MIKKRIIFVISAISFLLVFFFLCLMAKVAAYIYDTNSFHSTQEANEIQLLQDTSKKIGVDPSWLSIRDYIYCKSLKEGMSRTEVEDTLSKIGRIDGIDSGVYFLDRTLDTKLGPIFLVFDKSGPDGRLLRWKRSPDQNLGQPLAECEIDQ